MSNLPEGINRFYKENKEGLHLAEAAIQETVRLENIGNIPPATREMDWRGRNGGIRTIGLGISAELIQKGYTDLRGKRIRTHRQLAVLAQIYRDPRFETLRFFYVRNNTIVGHEGITSKIPGSCIGIFNAPIRENYGSDAQYKRQFSTARVRTFYEISRRMERLGATGYYLLHNHPSGVNIAPSKEDIATTQSFKDSLPGYLGHVIINSNKYGLIDRKMEVSEHTLTLGEDRLLIPSKPHEFLGARIASTSELARLAKSVQLDSEYSVLIFVSAQHTVRAIQEVPNGLFNEESHAVNYLRGRMREFGSTEAFLVTSDRYVKSKAVDMITKGYLLDAIVTGKEYSVITVRESGVTPFYNSSKWMGISADKGQRVNENIRTSPYVPRNPSPGIEI